MDWKAQGLHDWQRIAIKHGKAPPCYLYRQICGASDEDRRAWITKKLGVEQDVSRTVTDPWGNAVTIDKRAVDKAMLKVERAPLVEWLEFGIVQACERWEHVPTDRLERRRYYLTPLEDAKRTSVLVIVDLANVAFNVFQVDPSYANSERYGDLLNHAYGPGELCAAHGCCSDVVDLHAEIRKLEGTLRERDAKIRELRTKRKNPKAAP